MIPNLHTNNTDVAGTHENDEISPYKSSLEVSPSETSLEQPPSLTNLSQMNASLESEMNILTTDIDNDNERSTSENEVLVDGSKSSQAYTEVNFFGTLGEYGAVDYNNIEL